MKEFEIKLIKFINGEDVIAQVAVDTDQLTYRIKKPMKVVYISVDPTKLLLSITEWYPGCRDHDRIVEVETSKMVCKPFNIPQSDQLVETYTSMITEKEQLRESFRKKKKEILN